MNAGLTAGEAGQRTPRMSVRECAQIMGCGEQFIRISLQRGRVPWGYAEKTSDQWTYYINRAAFEKWLRGETG